MKSQDIIVKIMEMDLVQAYNWITTMTDAPKGVLKTARWGKLRPKIDIHDYIHGNLRTKWKKGKILYKGKAYNSEDFWTDMEDRQRIIKEWLIGYYDDGYIAMPRGLRKKENVKNNEKEESI